MTAVPGAREVREEDAFDVARVAAWIREHADDATGLDGEPEVRQFTGGASNLTYLLRFPGGRDPAANLDGLRDCDTRVGSGHGGGSLDRDDCDAPREASKRLGQLKRLNKSESMSANHRATGNTRIGPIGPPNEPRISARSRSVDDQDITQAFERN